MILPLRLFLQSHPSQINSNTDLISLQLHGYTPIQVPLSPSLEIPLPPQDPSKPCVSDVPLPKTQVPLEASLELAHLSLLKTFALAAPRSPSPSTPELQCHPTPWHFLLSTLLQAFLCVGCCLTHCCVPSLSTLPGTQRVLVKYPRKGNERTEQG